MTISTTIIKSSLNGNGSTSAFTYSFKITDDDDIQVIIRSATGTETVKSKGTHYNVSGVGNNSGTVTFTSGNIPASGETVVLRRSTPQTQAMDLIDNDPMSADTIETAHDKVVAITQELQEQLDRSIKISRTNTMSSTEFNTSPTNRAGKVLGFDNNGELAVTSEIGINKGNWAASTSYAIRDIVKDTSTNNIFMANAVHTSSGSQPLTTNTDSAKWDLLVDAASATAASTSATNSANAASASASTASGHASTATTKASEASASAATASTKASEATTAKNAAVTAQTAAETALDNFDDIYLGAKSSNPSVDNDGDALTAGDQYFNTNTDALNIWNGSAWVAISTVNSGTITGQTAETSIADNDLILISDTSASGALRKMTKANFVTGLGSASSIADTDSDTQIQVEESSDEDKLRFDTGGSERAVMDSSGFALSTNGGSFIHHNTIANDTTLANQNMLLVGSVGITGTLTIGSNSTVVVI